MLESRQWSIKKRIVSCYHHVTSNSIHLMVGTSQSYVGAVLKGYNLKMTKTSEPGKID